MINKNYTYAIIGASNNKQKYGNKIIKDLIINNYKVIPINPKEEKIEGIKAYKNISEVKNKIDVVVFITPPQITREVIKEVKKMKIKKVWFQPGSNNEETIKYCQENNIEYIRDACIMIEKNN